MRDRLGKRVLIERDGQDADVPTLDKRPLREVDESISDKLDVAASDSQTLNAGSLTVSVLCRDVDVKSCYQRFLVKIGSLADSGSQ